MKGRPPTKEEKLFMDEICQIGCIVCLNHGVYTPQVSPHHMEGKTKPGAHFKVIPLCGKHHQESDTQKPKRWIARHGGNGDGKHQFEQAYSKEVDLYHQCLDLMKERKEITSLC